MIFSMHPDLMNLIQKFSPIVFKKMEQKKSPNSFLSIEEQRIRQFAEKITIRVAHGSWQELAALKKNSKTESKAKLIKIFDNNQPTLVKAMENISFPNLQILSLLKSQLESIETLSRIQMPALKHLWINECHLSELKCLRKVHFPSLKQFCLNQNKINEFPYLQFLDAPELEILSLQSERNQIYQENLGWFFKQNCKNLKNLQLKSQHRLDNPTRDKKMRQKIPILWIQYKFLIDLYE